MSQSLLKVKGQGPLIGILEGGRPTPFEKVVQAPSDLIENETIEDSPCLRLSHVTKLTNPGLPVDLLIYLNTKPVRAHSKRP